MSSSSEILEGLDHASQKHEKEIVIELGLDRILYFIGVFLVILLAIISKFSEVTSKNLSCFPIQNEAGYTTSFINFADIYCWESSNISIGTLGNSTNSCMVELKNQTSRLLENPTLVKRFIQWMPYIMLLEAFLFALPSAIWHFVVGARLMGHLKFMQLLLNDIYESVKTIPAGIYRRKPYDKEGKYLNSWLKVKPEDNNQEHSNRPIPSSSIQQKSKVSNTEKIVSCRKISIAKNYVDEKETKVAPEKNKPQDSVIEERVVKTKTMKDNKQSNESLSSASVNAKDNITQRQKKSTVENKTAKKEGKKRTVADDQSEKEPLLEIENDKPSTSRQEKKIEKPEIISTSAKQSRNTKKSNETPLLESFGTGDASISQKQNLISKGDTEKKGTSENIQLSTIEAGAENTKQITNPNISKEKPTNKISKVKDINDSSSKSRNKVSVPLCGKSPTSKSRGGKDIQTLQKENPRTKAKSDELDSTLTNVSADNLEDPDKLPLLTSQDDEPNSCIVEEDVPRETPKVELDSHPAEDSHKISVASDRSEETPVMDSHSNKDEGLKPTSTRGSLTSDSASKSGSSLQCEDEKQKYKKKMEKKTKEDISDINEDDNKAQSSSGSKKYKKMKNTKKIQKDDPIPLHDLNKFSKSRNNTGDLESIEDDESTFTENKDSPKQEKDVPKEDTGNDVPTTDSHTTDQLAVIPTTKPKELSNTEEGGLKKIINTIVAPEFDGMEGKGDAEGCLPNRKPNEQGKFEEILVGDMKDRHIFSMLCFENFASLEHHPYLKSVHGLANVPGCEKERTCVLPLKHGILRQFCHKENFSSTFVIKTYILMCYLKIILSLFIFLAIGAVYFSILEQTLNADSFACDIPFHNLCFYCVLKGNQDILAVFLANSGIVTIHLILSIWQFYFVRSGHNLALCGYFEDIKDLTGVALVAAHKVGEKNNDK